MKQILSLKSAVIISLAEAMVIDHPSTIFTNDNVTVNIYADEATKNDSITKILASTIPVLPAVGEVKAGYLYQYSNLVLLCIQSHTRTVYDPLLTPALFAVYRDNAGTLAWVTNEQILIGWKRTYNSKVYVCIQSHQSQVTWNPELTLATLWQVIATSSAWTVGVAYKVNDIVTYLGKSYKCLQAHTSQAGWSPSAVPALWQLQ